MSRWQKSLCQAETHLQQSGEPFRKLIELTGPCTLRLDRNRYRMLVRSIISQQISGAAARSILGRVRDLVGATFPPESFAELGVERLREVGVSPQKGSYVLDLTARVLDARLDLGRMGYFSDEEVIERLIEVRGIGRWTAQMFLMFSLGRPDVLPELDLGVRKGMARILGLPQQPTPRECAKLAEPWRPFASVASWYCWRATELPEEDFPLSVSSA